jgi:hypothetical protein
MSNVVHFPKAKPNRRMLDIYPAGRGMRGLDAMLPVDLANQFVAMIKPRECQCDMKRRMILR